MREESQTLTRGLHLLDLLGSGCSGLAVRDLAHEMQLPKSIVQRLLNSLESQAFIVRHPSGKGYRLSAKLWALGCQAVNGSGLRDVARPHLSWLAERTQETVKLSMVEGADVISVDSIESSQAVRAYVPVGGRVPVDRSASGKAIVAFQGSWEQAEYAAIRKRGYAVNRGEWQAGVGAVAAPIFDADSNVLASVGVILPLIRLKAPRIKLLGEACMTTAGRISSELGFGADAPARRKKAG